MLPAARESQASTECPDTREILVAMENREIMAFQDPLGVKVRREKPPEPQKQLKKSYKSKVCPY